MSYTTNGIVKKNFGNYFNPDSEMIKFIGVDNMNIADDYFQNEIIHS
jgi:hypothetical protein